MWLTEMCPSNRKIIRADHLLNISLSLWSCQDGHVRCDRENDSPWGAEMWNGAEQSSCKGQRETDTRSPPFQPSVRSWAMIKNAVLTTERVCLDYTFHRNDLKISVSVLYSVLHSSLICLKPIDCRKPNSNIIEHTRFYSDITSTGGQRPKCSC